LIRGFAARALDFEHTGELLSALSRKLRKAHSPKARPEHLELGDCAQPSGDRPVAKC